MTDQRKEPAEIAEAELEQMSGGVDPTNPNVVYVGGSRYAADDKRNLNWDKVQELRSGK